MGPWLGSPGPPGLRLFQQEKPSVDLAPRIVSDGHSFACSPGRNWSELIARDGDPGSILDACLTLSDDDSSGRRPYLGPGPQQIRVTDQSP